MCDVEHVSSIDLSMRKVDSIQSFSYLPRTTQCIKKTVTGLFVNPGVLLKAGKECTEMNGSIRNGMNRSETLLIWDIPLYIPVHFR